MEVFDNGREAAGVVIMRVGEGYHVDPADGAAPKIRRDHIFADVDARAAVGSEREYTASIDEQELRIGKADQQAVSLSDIDGREFEFARVQGGREWMPEDQAKQR